MKPIDWDAVGAAMQAHVDSLVWPPDYSTWYNMSKKYLDLVQPTYIEAWPDALCRLSVAQVKIQLTLDEADTIGANNGEWAEEFPEPLTRDLTSIKLRLDEALDKFPNGAFVRLGSRSPKDSYRGYKDGFKITTGEQAIALLIDSSERIYEDLMLAKQNNYAPCVWVRQWLKFEPWQEFRCFQKDGNLVGVSQYNHRHDYPEIAQHADLMMWGIKQFHSQFFRDASHLSSVVFDVIAFIKNRTAPSGMVENEIEIKLLEINPFFEMTDPCLFNWAKPEEMIGQMRYKNAAGVQELTA